MTNALGQNANLQITLTVPAGLTTVTGTLSGLPSGVSGSPKTTMTLLPGTQTIPLSVISAPGPTPGTYALTMTVTAGTQQVSGTGTLTVTQAGGTGSNGPLAVSMGSVTLANALGQDVNLQITLTVPAGFTTAVIGTLSGLPSGISGSPQTTMTLLPGTQTIPLSVISAPGPTPGTYALTMTATAGTQQVSGTATLTVTQAPAAGFSVPVNSLSIAPGQSNSITLVCVTPSGANCTLSTTIAGLPSGITVSPAPPFNVTTQGITITFSVSSSVPFGTYPITFVGQNGSYTATFALALIIQDGNYWLTGPNPSSLALRSGATASVAIGSSFGNPNASPNYQLKLTVSGLPSGTSAIFSPTDTIIPGQSTTLTITAAANAPVSHNNSVLVTATPTDGGFVYSNALILDVIPPSGQLATSRSDIVPTDGDIVSAVYDPVHKVVFGSNPVWNRVDVISPTTKTVVRSIQIPSPNKLELSLDGTKVIVGTRTSKAYWIDTSSLRVTASKKFPAPAGGLSPYLQTVQQVNELSTGELMVVSSTMGSPFICASDASTCRQLKGAPGNDLISASANGAKVLIGEYTSPPSAAVYDAASASLSTPVGLFAIAIDPTGTYCLVSEGANGSAVSLYDTQLGQQQRVLLPAGEMYGSPKVVFSLDGKTVYVVGAAGYSANSVTVTYTIDMASGAQLGVAPTLASWIQSNYEAEVPYAADSSGLIFGGLSHALAIDDSTFYTNEPLSSGPVPWLTVQSGPVNAATPVSFGGTAYTYTPDVYFGGVFAPSTLSGGTLTSIVPARSTPGPINVKMEFADGSEGFKPWAFTYGPWLQFADSGTSASGGAAAALVGMGLGSDPSKVQVSIGGAAAQVTSVTALTTSNGLMPIYPFASATVIYVVPPGVPGTADISVTTSAGTSTLKSAMRYSQVEDYSSSDTFTAVLYDRVRNQLYLTAGNHIDVFNLASNSFSAPIVPPTLSGETGFAGMALTPDGSKLLIANTTDGSLAVVNPDMSAPANAYPVFGPQVNGTCILGPAKVAGTSDNRALVALGANPAGCGAQGMGLYSLDLTTGVSSNLVTTASCGSSDVTASRDGSRIIMSPPGSTPCIYDVNAHTFNAFGSVYATSAAISGDGTLAAAPEYSNQWDIADLTGAIVGHTSLPDVFPAGVTLSSSALNDSGSLMYLANGSTTTSGGGKTSSFVDVIDVNHGIVRSRVRLSENIQSVMTPMAVDPADARIFLITDKGLTVVTVSGTPLSIGTVSPDSGSAGSLVTLRGSGFQMGMTATLNGTAANVVVLDPQTAQVTVPVVNSGMAKLILTNPDGQIYSLEGAFATN